jgi:hypothetical protein
LTIRQPELVAVGSRIVAAADGPGSHGVKFERIEPIDSELCEQVDAAHGGGRRNARQRLDQSRVCLGTVAQCLIGTRAEADQLEMRRRVLLAQQRERVEAGLTSV